MQNVFLNFDAFNQLNLKTLRHKLIYWLRHTHLRWPMESLGSFSQSPEVTVVVKGRKLKLCNHFLIRAKKEHRKNMAKV